MEALIGIPEAEMIRIAEENLATEEWKFRSIVETMTELMGCVDLDIEAPEIPMYVLTNPESFLGARLLHAPGILDYIREQIDKDYFILPSSTHEILIIPDAGGTTAEELVPMVKEINQTEVEPKNRLSDHVYHYSEEKGITTVA